jgi:hypothetical protein
MHFDLVVSGEGSDEEKWHRVLADMARLEALGATARGRHQPRYAGMSDPEGNEFDVTRASQPAG